MCVHVRTHVCMFFCCGAIFRYYRKHPTDDCHSNRSGGRRKMWCGWLTFFLNTVFIATWIILKTKERHFSNKVEMKKKSSMIERRGEEVHFLTFHGYRWHLLYAFEEEMQLRCDIVQWQSEAAVNQQCGGCSVGMHRPRADVMNGNIKLQSFSHLLVIKMQEMSDVKQMTGKYLMKVND